MLLFVHVNIYDACRGKGILDQYFRLRAPVDDINLLAAKLVNYRVNTGAVYADACADRVNVLIVGIYGHLRSLACLTADSLNLHGAVRNLGNLVLEKSFNKIRMGTGYGDLRSLRSVLNFENVNLYTLAGTERLAANLLGLDQKRVHLAEIQRNRGSVDSLNNAGNNLMLLAGILIV